MREQFSVSVLVDTNTALSHSNHHIQTREFRGFLFSSVKTMFLTQISLPLLLQQ